MEKLKKNKIKNNNEDQLMAKKVETQVIELRKDVSHLTELVKNGFKQVHLRQDVANGKIQKHEIQFAKIDGKYMEKGDVKLLVSDQEKDDIKRFSDIKGKMLGFLIGIAGTVLTYFLIKSFGG